eukprot:2397979-Rhodomonas_salina.4
MTLHRAYGTWPVCKFIPAPSLRILHTEHRPKKSVETLESEQKHRPCRQVTIGQGICGAKQKHLHNQEGADRLSRHAVPVEALVEGFAGVIHRRHVHHRLGHTLPAHAPFSLHRTRFPLSLTGPSLAPVATFSSCHRN